MPWANSTGIVYNTWKPTSKQPKCIISRFLGFLSCSQDLEGLNQEETLSVMDCPGGWSRHRHERCTLEDQALLSVLGTANCQATSWWALSCCFLSHFPGYKCPAKKPPQEKQTAGHRGFFLVSLSSRERVCSLSALSQGPLLLHAVPFETAQNTCDFITCPHNLSSSWLNETISCLLKSWPCLFVSFALPTLGPCEEYPSRYGVSRDPIYPSGLSSPEERTISHILQTMLLFRYLGRIFTV